MGGDEGRSVSSEGRDFHDNSCQRVDEIHELTYPVLQIPCISLILPSFATIITQYGAYISFTGRRSFRSVNNTFLQAAAVAICSRERTGEFSETWYFFET